MKKADQKKVWEKVREQVEGLLADHGDRCMKGFDKTDKTYAISLRISLKGDNEEISYKTSINYTDDKIHDWAEEKINVLQDEIDFKEGDTMREEDEQYQPPAAA